MGTNGQTETKIWKERINQYRASGLNAADWSEKNSVSVHVLRKWITKLNMGKRRSKNKQQWVSIKPEEKTTTKPSPIIIKVGKATVHVPIEFDTDALKKIMEVLQKQC